MGKEARNRMVQAEVRVMDPAADKVSDQEAARVTDRGEGILMAPAAAKTR